MIAAALEITDLHAWYGDAQILHGVSLSVMPGEVVALLGRNGAGRTTLLRAILGLADTRKGSIRIHGTETINSTTYRIADLGIGYCPEERGIFASLTCEENLLLPLSLGNTAGGGMSLAEIYEIFPKLLEQRLAICTSLSGGEQQILKVARLLRTGANLLLLDELSDGLEPIMLVELTRMVTALKQKGYTIILTEHDPQLTEALVDRYYVLDHGEITEAFQASELASKQHALATLLGH